MLRISEENSSPLIVECRECGHREYAEIQITPPWAPDGEGQEEATRSTIGKTEYRLWDSSAMPVSVGSPDDEGTILPLGWILLWFIIIALISLGLWIVL